MIAEESESEIKISGIVRLYILVTLESSPMHGYRLMKELEKKLGKKPSAAHVYPFLIELEKNGYLIVREEGKRRKKVYELTQRGHELVQHVTSRVLSILDAALDKKLKVCVNCGCKIYEGGYSVKIKDETLMFCCEHCARNYLESHAMFMVK
ncbi:MAG: PadR family transcriptional regulator [Thermoprotei archaeon]